MHTNNTLTIAFDLAASNRRRELNTARTVCITLNLIISAAAHATD